MFKSPLLLLAHIAADFCGKKGIPSVRDNFSHTATQGERVDGFDSAQLSQQEQEPRSQQALRLFGWLQKCPVTSAA